MADTITITLPDGTTKAVPAGTPARTIAEAIGPRLAKAAVAARIDGEIWDLARPIRGDARLEVLTDRDAAALDVLRHSAAHILATAVRQLFPEAHIGFGPPIQDGFYYDFEVPRPFTPDDLTAIEAKMQEVIAADYPFAREEVDRPTAEQRFRDDPLKLERLAELGDD
ncbi:MAG: TGS domain-containing protein, partial [Gemmatimonadota bacterium]|nr:TGS domain-containing protein [Gemmatimonadota bacterium]